MRDQSLRRTSIGHKLLLGLLIVALVVMGMAVYPVNMASAEVTGNTLGKLQDVASEKTEGDLEKISAVKKLVSTNAESSDAETAAKQMELKEKYYAIYDNIKYGSKTISIRATVKMTYEGDPADRYESKTGTDPDDNNKTVTYWTYTYEDPDDKSKVEVFRYSGKYYTDTTSTKEATIPSGVTPEQKLAIKDDGSEAKNEPRSEDPTYYTIVSVNKDTQLLQVQWARAFNTKVEWKIETLQKKADGTYVPYGTNLAVGIMDPDESNYLFDYDQTKKALYYVSAPASDEGTQTNFGDFAEAFTVTDKGIFTVNKDGENKGPGYTNGKILQGMSGDDTFTFTTETFSGGILTVPFLFILTFKATYTSDDGGSITGITEEELDDNDNPTGSSQKTKDGYRFTGWTADKDVTLEDGTVIPAGTVLTEDQIKQVVMDKDITFTANHELIPNLEIKKTVDPKVCTVGDTVTYTVEMKQTVEGAKARNIDVKDVMDDGIELVADSFSDNIKELAGDIKTKTNSYELTIPELSDSITFTYDATIVSEGKDMKNTITATSPDLPDEIEVLSETETVSSYTPEPYIKKTSDVKSAVVGDTVTYKVKMGNKEKHSVIHNAEMSDTLPAGLKLVKDSVKVSDNTADVSVSGQTLTVTVEDLSDEVTITYKAKLTSTAKGSLKNTATLSGDNIDDVSDAATVSASLLKKVVTKIVRTGDATTITTLVALALLALSGVVMSLRRKNNNA